MQKCHICRRYQRHFSARNLIAARYYAQTPVPCPHALLLLPRQYLRRNKFHHAIVPAFSSSA